MDPGFFGKLPTHGDFVSRGWPEEVTQFVDGWFSEGINALHARHGDESSERIAAAQPLLMFAPPGVVPSGAIFACLTPTIDRVGRRHLLLIGYYGTAAMLWAAAGHSDAHRLGPCPDWRASSETANADALLTRLESEMLPPDDFARFLGSLWQPDHVLVWTPDRSLFAQTKTLTGETLADFIGQD